MAEFYLHAQMFTLPHLHDFKSPNHTTTSVSSASSKTRHDQDIIPAQKRAHSTAERRYRLNLNRAIASLRDSLPSLRFVRKIEQPHSNSSSSPDSSSEGSIAFVHSPSERTTATGTAIPDLPAPKLNKPLILSKAVQYISQLKTQITCLEQENHTLKHRIVVLEKVITQDGHDEHRILAFTSSSVVENAETVSSRPPPSDSSADEYSMSGLSSPSRSMISPREHVASISTPETSVDGDEHENEENEGRSGGGVRGLIPVPEAWRRLRDGQSWEHYGHVYR